MKLVKEKQAAQRLEVLAILKKGERIAVMHIHKGQAGRRQIDVHHVAPGVFPQTSTEGGWTNFVDVMAGMRVDGHMLYRREQETAQLTQLLHEYHRARTRFVARTKGPISATRELELRKPHEKVMRKIKALGAEMLGMAPFDLKTGKRLTRREGGMYFETGEAHDGERYVDFDRCVFLPGLDRLTAMGYSVWKVL